MILGVAGKMGPTLAGLAKAALPDRRVIGVARFSDAGVKTWLQARGIETINCDLLDRPRSRHCRNRRTSFHGRPQVRRRGRPFADLGDERPCPRTGRAGLSGSRIVAFSTGCVYPFVPVAATAPTRAATQSARRIRAILRRPRAHVRIFLAQIQQRPAGCSG